MRKILFTVVILTVILLLSGCPNDPKTTTYGVTVSQNGNESGESVSADVSEVVEGTTVTLTASLNSSRQVALSASGVSISPATIISNGGTATFTMPASAVEVTATFTNITAGALYIPTANTVSFKMHYVPSGGTFTMGENVESTTQEVTLTKNFWMGETEVTQGLWEDVWGTIWPGTDPENESYGAGTDYPAYYVNWYDAVAFCNLLTQADDSIADGQQVYYSDQALTTAYTKADAENSSVVYVDWTKTGYRLPTEAEWEYAARYIDGTNWNGGDHVSGGTLYTDETDPDKIGDYGWYDGNSGDPGSSQKVGLKTANTLGLRDMSGNILEWCYDLHDTYSGESETDPTGSESTTMRVARGGCWKFANSRMRCANRNPCPPATRAEPFGFRLCRTGA